MHTRHRIGARERAGPQTGRQHQRVVFDDAALTRLVDHGHRLRVGVDGADGGTETQRDIRIGIEGSRFEVDAVVLAQQHRLRQRRTIIRRMRFGTDQRDRLVVPVGAEVFGHTDRSESRPDDHDTRCCAHEILSFGTITLARSGVGESDASRPSDASASASDVPDGCEVGQ